MSFFLFFFFFLRSYKYFVTLSAKVLVMADFSSFLYFITGAGAGARARSEIGFTSCKHVFSLVGTAAAAAAQLCESFPVSDDPDNIQRFVATCEE